jgi:hypothetical protein
VERHCVCLLDAQGAIISQRWIEHSGSGLALLSLRRRTGGVERRGE